MAYLVLQLTMSLILCSMFVIVHKKCPYPPYVISSYTHLWSFYVQSLTISLSDKLWFLGRKHFLYTIEPWMSDGFNYYHPLPPTMSSVVCLYCLARCLFSQIGSTIAARRYFIMDNFTHLFIIAPSFLAIIKLRSETAKELYPLQIHLHANNLEIYLWHFKFPSQNYATFFSTFLQHY